jgi:hypothetical protein
MASLNMQQRKANKAGSQQQTAIDDNITTAEPALRSGSSVVVLALVLAALAGAMITLVYQSIFHEQHRPVFFLPGNKTAKEWDPSVGGNGNSSAAAGSDRANNADPTAVWSSMAALAAFASTQAVTGSSVGKRTPWCINGVLRPVQVRQLGDLSSSFHFKFPC